RSWKPISAGLCQPAHCVHRSGPQTNDEVAGADEREGFLLGDCAVRNRSEDFRIEPRKARQLLGIHLVALSITVRDRPQLAHVGHDYFMAQLLKLLADPYRVCPCFHGDPHSRQVGKPLIDAGWVGSEPAPVDNFTIFVERAVMAPNISKIDPDCYPNLGASPWYFRDEVLRMPFHPHSLSLLQSDRLIPVFGKCRLRRIIDSNDYR
ncbi:MAG: hypothetical protein QOH35_5819, partial [Acidobacteriaceae bacterium]|nr:hypothetical protein [Acidobacteriaceae bacterium]